VDAKTWAAIASAGADPAGALQKHESNRALSAANAIMIFKPEEDTSAQRTRDAPRVNGVDDMPQVKIASW
jgi:hypothetical protein